MLDGRTGLDREKARQRFDEFHREVAQAVEEIRLQALPSEMAVPTVLGDLVALTMGKFEDGYHTTGDAHVRVVALGHWKSGMAPPSILEFFVTILLRQSIAMISPAFRASGHIGTKGCLFDFTDDLADARFKTMQGYVCTECRAALATDHRPRLVGTLIPILDTRRWLGLSSGPKTPAGVVANLGHDLFLTRGAEPTAYQRLLVSLRDDGVKEIIKIVALAVVTSLLIWIGLTKPWRFGDARRPTARSRKNPPRPIVTRMSPAPGVELHPPRPRMEGVTGRPAGTCRRPNSLRPGSEER